MRKSQIVAICALFSFAGSLSGCAVIEQQMPIVALLDRGPQPPNIAFRQDRLSEVPHYRPVKSCTYKAGFGAKSSTQSITIQTVRNRLLVTSDNNVGGKSTALISATGHRYSFNMFDPRSGSQISSDRWSGQMASEGVALKSNMDLVVPDYIPGPKEFGQIVSLVTDSRGNSNAAFLYAGIGTYQGKEVILLRFVVNPTGSAKDLNRAVGYSIIDTRLALPIKFSIGRGPNIRLESTGCAE